MDKLNRIRFMQAGCFAFAVFAYFFVYRKYLLPKPVYNSHSYAQACEYLKGNAQVKQMIGKDIHVMTCNGKQLPFKNEFDFDLILFGTI